MASDPLRSEDGEGGMAHDLPQAFGRYRIVKTLGEGAMGAVYLARDTQLDRLVALKVPKLQKRVATHPEGPNPERTAPKLDREGRDEEKETPDTQTLERFFREARSAAALNHPNICAIHDIGEIDGTPFLTMSYLEGRTLAELVEQDKPMDQHQASAIVCTLAQAMQEAHSRGVIHRDLKPSNVMITGRGEPVIMDFGIARRDEPIEARLTRTGAILGTPAFMAPEQIEGDPDAVGRACDIYSLGVILYELLTGRLPFGGSVIAMLGKILHEPPEPPSKYRPDLDSTLESVCLKAMAKRPEDRYPSMADFASALEEYLRRLPGTETLETPSRAWAKAVAGNRPQNLDAEARLLAGGAVCLASVLAGFVVYDGYKRTSMPAPARSDPPRLDARSRTQANPPASPVPVPKQGTPGAPVTPPSQLAATIPAPMPSTSRPRSSETPNIKTMTDSIGINLVLIPSGTFQMGSVEGEGEADEHPSHEVRISRPFYLGIHEVTQGQYRAVMGNNPSWFSIDNGIKDGMKELAR